MQKTCLNCGTQFHVKKSHYDIKSYCSSACMAIHYKIRLTGKQNPNYKNAGEKTCKWCSKTYHSYNHKRKFCSRYCYGKQTSGGMPSTREIKRLNKRDIKIKRPHVCIDCGSMDIPRKAKRCVKCRTEIIENINKKHTKNCCVCGKQFIPNTNSRKRKTCGPHCSGMWSSIRQKGEKSHLWKGGKTSQAMIVRTSFAYSEWRKSVFRRDDWQCAKCGKTGQLHAHHIKSFSQYPELRLSVDNGITLCHACHSIVDPIAKNLIGKKCVNLLMSNIASKLDSDEIIYFEQFPFIYFAINGTAYCIHILGNHGTCTPEQSAVQSRMALNGWAVFIVRDFDSFLKILTMAEQKGVGRP